MINRMPISLYLYNHYNKETKKGQRCWLPPDFRTSIAKQADAIFFIRKVSPMKL